MIINQDTSNKEWYYNGILHRIDGPAIEYANGDKKNGISKIRDIVLMVQL